MNEPSSTRPVRALPAPLSAQGYPNKSVRVVVPFAPGGATDIHASAGNPINNAPVAVLPAVFDPSFLGGAKPSKRLS